MPHHLNHTSQPIRSHLSLRVEVWKGSRLTADQCPLINRGPGSPAASPAASRQSDHASPARLALVAGVSGAAAATANFVAAAVSQQPQQCLPAAAALAVGMALAEAVSPKRRKANFSIESPPALSVSAARKLSGSGSFQMTRGKW